MSGIDAAQPWHDADRVYPGLQTWDVFTGELHAWRLRDADAKPPSDHRDGDLILALEVAELKDEIAGLKALLAKQNAPAAAPPLSMMTTDHWLPCSTHIAHSAGVHHTLWPAYRDGTDPLD